MGDNFGSGAALSADGRYVLAGAPGDDDNGEGSGSAYVYDLSQPPPMDEPYVYALGGTSFDEGTGVGLDGAGNATFIGEFRGTLDFDPGDGTAELTSTQSDVYVVSYDPSGALRFAFRIGNALATSEAAGGIAVDEAGNFVITGSQPFGAIDFDPDPVGEELRTGKLFIAGYDADGGFRFAVTPEGGTTTAGIGHAVDVDGAGNVYVTGQFSGTLNFAPGVPQPVFLTSQGGTDAFVASYAPDGTSRFAFRLGGAEADTGEGIAVDAAGNVYVTGQFGPVAAKIGGEDAGGSVRRAFLLSYDPDGILRYAYLFGDDARGSAIALDDAGNVYLSGAFTGTAVFDFNDTDGDGDIHEVSSVAGGSTFLASYTSDGTFRFVSVIDGTSNTLALATLGSGTSAITGSFGGTVDFDPGSGVNTLTAGGGTDVLVASYNASGAFRSVFGFGGNGLNAGTGVAVGADEYFLLTGHYSGTTDFDPGPDTDERTSAGQDDLFMMKVRPVNPPVVVEEPAAVPNEAALSAAYPNPFAARTELRLRVPHRQRVVVTVYDVMGRRIAVLLDGMVDPGPAQLLAFDAGSLPAGVYLIRAVGETFQATRRVVRVR